MTSLLGKAHLMDLVLAITIFEGLLLAAYHHRTGLPHGKIHAELRRRCGGAPTARRSRASRRSRC